MATTTTINPTKDNWIYESSSGSKYGNGANLKIGVSGAITHMSGVFEFDVSAYTTPSDIVSAMFSLTANNSAGSSTNTVTLARLSQDFDETNSNWNYSDDPTEWTTAGAMDDAETTEPTYTFDVGSTSDISVDIRELVVDAINRRSGVLRFICYYDPTPSSSGYTTFDSRTNSSGDYPEVAITVADRIEWVGDSVPDQGDLDVAANWSPNSVPGASDIAIFGDGGGDVTVGTLACWKANISRGYTSTMGAVARYDLDYLYITSPKSDLNITVNRASGTCSTIVGDCDNLTLAGDCEVSLLRSRSTITLTGTDITILDCHSGGVSVTCEESIPTVRLSRCTYTLDDGAGTLTVGSHATGTVSMVTNNRTDIVQAGGNLRILAEEVDDITTYSGKIRYTTQNEGAPILTGDVIIYSSLVDTRTKAATYTSGSITMYGGRLLLDAGQAVSIT